MKIQNSISSLVNEDVSLLESKLPKDIIESIVTPFLLDASQMFDDVHRFNTAKFINLCKVSDRKARMYINRCISDNKYSLFYDEKPEPVVQNKLVSLGFSLFSLTDGDDYVWMITRVHKNKINTIKRQANVILTDFMNELKVQFREMPALEYLEGDYLFLEQI